MADWHQVGSEDLKVQQRMLMDHPGGVVKLLAMEAGGYYPLHHHPDRHEWVYVLEGQFETEVDGEVRTLSPGDFREFPTWSQHRLAAPHGKVLAVLGALPTTVEARQ